MMSQISNHGADEHIDRELAEYLDPDKPRCFFLFAGAGSGKTWSLVEGLKHIRREHLTRLALRGQRVAVITYTNAARDVIIGRIKLDPLFYVVTINSFAWELIQNFTEDIRECLTENISADIADLERREASPRARGAASLDRRAKIKSKSRRLQQVQHVRRFAYSPGGENRSDNSLNHSEVIEICASFLQKKSIMQWILVGRFPILLIDEAQDTNKRIVEALLETAKEHETRFVLGLIGDTMQSIYDQGKADIGEHLPPTWATPAKRLNRRSTKRVVRLINRIRGPVSIHFQEPLFDAQEGHARLFIYPADGSDRRTAEAAVRSRMYDATGDVDWQERSRCKTLTLEHRMAAERLGFEQFFEPLWAVTEWRTAIREGSSPVVRLFTDDILTLVRSTISGDKFAVARLVRERSPLLSHDALKVARDPTEPLQRAHAAVKRVMDSITPSATCGDVFNAVVASDIFRIPDIMAGAAAIHVADQLDSQLKENLETDEVAFETKAILTMLQAPFSQVELYKMYAAGESEFDTHHGVKGLEFERVMVVIDDAAAGGFRYSYEKLFGAKSSSGSDEATRRLLYVTCSRAERSLALVVYTANPNAVKTHALNAEWFTESEIECVEG